MLDGLVPRLALLAIAGCVGLSLAAIAGCTKQPPPTASPPTAPQPKAPVDPHDQLADEILSGMDKLVGELAEIKTTEAANAAVPQLEREADELRYAVDRLKELPALPANVKDEKKASYADRVAATADEFERQMRRIRTNSQVKKPFTELQSRLFKLKTRLNDTALAFPRDASPSGSVSMPPPGFGPPGFGPPPGFGGPPLVVPGSLPQMEGPDVAEIVVSGVPSGMFGRLSDVVLALNDYRPHSAHATGGKATFRLSRIRDFQKLPENITFGKITSVDEEIRRIDVDLDPAKIP